MIWPAASHRIHRHLRPIYDRPPNPARANACKSSSAAPEFSAQAYPKEVVHILGITHTVLGELNYCMDGLSDCA